MYIIIEDAKLSMQGVVDLKIKVEVNKFEWKMKYSFNTKNSIDFKELRKILKSNKDLNSCNTWGEVIKACPNKGISNLPSIYFCVSSRRYPLAS